MSHVPLLSGGDLVKVKVGVFRLSLGVVVAPVVFVVAPVVAPVVVVLIV